MVGINQPICPECGKKTIKLSSTEIYCQNCGLVFNNIVTIEEALI
ncbi:MAG: hypothetical protein QXJ06_00320 [Candidatus Aenigmatarchaeota archaeon]